MTDHARFSLTAHRPTDQGERCGTWPLQLAPQLAKVRSSIEELARGRYAHPSIDRPEPSLLGALERLALVVSELGGNALRHAQAPVTVTLSRLRRGWLLQVSDGDPVTRPILAPESVSRGQRHGLQVVSIVSAEIGWYAEGECKHVWAVVPDESPAGLSKLIEA